MQTAHGGPANPAKRTTRQLFRTRRSTFVASLIAPAREALERQLATILGPLAALPGPVASHAAVGDEIDPRFAEQIFDPSAFPRIAGPDLSFHLAPRTQLIPGPLGIPQPAESAPRAIPRLLLIPLIAATPAGIRLGQGGGYYDRTLVQLRATAPTIAIGLCWDCQLTDHLPQEPHDQMLDWIATPTRLVECARNR